MKTNSKKIHGVIFPKVDRIPRVYFAGKIRKSCWRHGLVSGLRDHHWSLGPLVQKNFICIGPFFISCDHGCYHQGNTHGTSNPQLGACPPDVNYGPPQVAELCRQKVSEADLVFCFIDSLDCYGTIAEIERAHVFGIPVVIAFAPDIAEPEKNDFWFISQRATKVYFDITEAELPEIFQMSLKEFQ
jgi:hypothetical protein